MKIRAFAIIAALATPALADEPTPQDKDKSTVANDKTPPSSNDKTTANKGAKLSDGDVKIISHLHHVNQMEIDMGKAAQRSGTAQVKSYAQTLVTDHQSSDKDLTAFTRTHKLAAIPPDKAESDADRQAQKDMTTSIAHLKTLKGAEFDKEFLNMMVSGHEQELAKIDTSISSATDPDLQSMLKSVKPVLQRHADSARDLQKSPQASADQKQPNDPNKPNDRLPSSH